MYSRVVNDLNSNVLLDNVDRLDAEKWLLDNRKEFAGIEGFIAIEDIDDNGDMIEWYLLDQLIEDACGIDRNLFKDY